ncbi:hypothetical protein HDV00_000155 [Rhizophlyctis rosea]|nr:hypothetical protein HDV00_000155 [Rhizophlyctis rosea]
MTTIATMTIDETMTAINTMTRTGDKMTVGTMTAIGITHNQKHNNRYEPYPPRPDTGYSNAQKQSFQVEGIANVGQTCYIAAVVQMLYYSPFAELFINEAPQSPGTVCRALMDIFQRRREKRSVDVSDFRSLMAKATGKFNSRRQEDAHEFFRALLDRTHLECFTKAVPTSPIHATFQWETQICFTCTGCKEESKVPEIMMDLPLSLDMVPPDGNRSVAASLLHFFKEEEIERNCEKCSCKKSRCRRVMKRYPRLLVVQLNRFQVEAGQSFIRKRTEEVNIPTELMFSENEGSGSIKYHVRGIVAHIGRNSFAGHYVCDIYDRRSTRWKRFNDSRVMDTPEDPTRRNREAYLIMYERDV